MVNLLSWCTRGYIISYIQIYLFSKCFFFRYSTQMINISNLSCLDFTQLVHIWVLPLLGEGNCFEEGKWTALCVQVWLGESISSGGQYVASQKYFSHPSLVVYFLCNPAYQTEPGTAHSLGTINSKSDGPIHMMG